LFQFLRRACLVLEADQLGFSIGPRTPAGNYRSVAQNRLNPANRSVDGRNELVPHREQSV
jgi:hypothetical protein